jgi:hypothetical protein
MEKGENIIKNNYIKDSLNKAFYMERVKPKSRQS